MNKITTPQTFKFLANIQLIVEKILYPNGKWKDESISKEKFETIPTKWE